MGLFTEGNEGRRNALIGLLGLGQNELVKMLSDKGFQGAIEGGLKSAGSGVSRGISADLLGAPVDAVTAALNLGIAGAGYAGHKAGILSEPLPLIDAPVGGSEWIGNKMERGGLLAPSNGSGAETGGRILGGLLASPQVAGRVGAVAEDVTRTMANNAMQPKTLHPQAGMLKLTHGRVPENSKDVQLLSKQLEDRARAAGLPITVENSRVSPSTYITFGNPADEMADSLAQVRISNHADYNKGMAAGIPRMSVDPNTLNSYEDAISWLKNFGVNVPSRLPPAKKLSYSPVSEDAVKKILGFEQWPSDATKNYWLKNFAMDSEGRVVSLSEMTDYKKAQKIKKSLYGDEVVKFK